MNVSDNTKQAIIDEYNAEKMRKLGAISSRAKTQAARANGAKAGDVLRTSKANLINGARAVAGGMSLSKAARTVAKCRLATLRDFLAKWNVPPSK